MTEPSQFHAETFALDGELIGTKPRLLAELSEKWLSVCQAFLDRNGPSFRESLGQMLSHIEIQLASSAGVALGMFYVHGKPVLSTAFFTGFEPAAETQLLAAFVKSLQDSTLVQRAAASAHPFAAVGNTVDRPLSVFVTLDASDLSEQDADLVRELSEHLAGAYIRREYRLRA